MWPSGLGCKNGGTPSRQGRSDLPRQRPPHRRRPRRDRTPEHQRSPRDCIAGHRTGGAPICPRREADATIRALSDGAGSPL